MASVAELKNSHLQAQQAGASASVPAKKERTIFDFLSGDKKIERAIGAVAGTYFTPDRFLRLAVNAVKRAPLLAQCDASTVLGAFMTSAALGLEPNTVLQQAFLIPYKKNVPVRKGSKTEWETRYECNFQIGARGFVTLAHRSPHVSSLQSEAIHENDVFDHMIGTETFLRYKKSLKERGDLIGSFCFTKLASGIEMATVLPLDEIMKIRGRSETYNALSRALLEAQAGDDVRAIEKARQKLDETPWVMWADDMAAKSATKKHCKQLPLSPGDALSVAANLDGDDGRTIDMASMTDPDIVRAVMKDGVDAAADSSAGGAGGEVFGMRDHLLEDAPSPTLDTMQAGARNILTVDARDVHEAPRHAQSATLHQLDERSLVEKLKHQLSTMTDVDQLDTTADLITSTTDDPGEQADLRNVYRARRAVLMELPGAALPTPQADDGIAIRRQRRSNMTID